MRFLGFPWGEAKMDRPYGIVPFLYIFPLKF